MFVVGGGLVHTSLIRRKAAQAGGPEGRFRLLDDLRPAEDLLVDFVNHSAEIRDVLTVLVAADKPRSFTRIVHEIRFRRANFYRSEQRSAPDCGCSGRSFHSRPYTDEEGWIHHDQGRT